MQLSEEGSEMARFICAYYNVGERPGTTSDRPFRARSLAKCVAEFHAWAIAHRYDNVLKRVSIRGLMIWDSRHGDFDRIEPTRDINLPHLAALDAFGLMCGEEPAYAFSVLNQGVELKSRGKAVAWTTVRAMLHLQELRGLEGALNLNIWRLPFMISAHQRLAVVQQIPILEARDAALRGPV
jgi:hypothetical protein